MVFAEQIATYATKFWSQGAVKNIKCPQFTRVFTTTWYHIQCPLGPKGFCTYTMNPNLKIKVQFVQKWHHYVDDKSNSDG